MFQPRTRTREYWEHDFTLGQTDIDQIYNHFLEVIRPQRTADIVRVVMRHRIAEEKNDIMRRISGRNVYQPRNSYAVGDEVLFPAIGFASGSVTELRDGYNPQQDPFKVFAVTLNGKRRQFACDLQSEHPANLSGDIEAILDKIDVNQLVTIYGPLVEPQIQEMLLDKSEFIYLGGKWFVKALLADVSIGHLHLAEAVLDMSGGGPLTTDEVLVHLDLDPSVDRETLAFSLNYALLNDQRFDEVAPKGEVAWYLVRMEPPEVRSTPPRLKYDPVDYDRALISPQLSLLENQLADEWSDLDAPDYAPSTTITLLYPHRTLGTLPLTNTIRNMLPLGRSPHHIITLRDEEAEQDIKVWVIKEGRYIYGLKQWYEANEIVVGAYITLRRGPKPDVLILDFERRRPQREDVRLATVVNKRLRFQQDRRRVGCGYDEMLVVGTDSMADIDDAWKRAADRSLASLLAEVLPALAELSRQDAVHSKTIYSVVNMLRRVPPGPVFAELVRHPAFQAIGDQYWSFNERRWQKE